MNSKLATQHGNNRHILVLNGIGYHWAGTRLPQTISGEYFRREWSALAQLFASIAPELNIDITDRSDAIAHSVLVSTRPEQIPAINLMVHAGLAAELQERGFSINYCIGRDIGEVAAAYIAGAIDARQAVLLAQYHGRLLAAATRLNVNRMVIHASHNIVQSLIDAHHMDVMISAQEHPERLVVQGSSRELSQLELLLNERRIFHRYLRSSLAINSPLLRNPGISFPALGTLPKNQHCGFIPSAETQPSFEQDALQYWEQSLFHPTNFWSAFDHAALSGDLLSVIDSSPKKSLSHLSGKLSSINTAVTGVREIFEPHPDQSHTASGAGYRLIELDRDDHRFQQAIDLVKNSYREKYGAELSVKANSFIAVEKNDRLLACFSLTGGESAALFSERYLDAPCEALIGEAQNEVVDRKLIAEVGSFSAIDTNASVLLFNDIPEIAYQNGYRYVLITIGSYVQELFKQKGISLVKLGDASASALPAEERAQWGSYYETNPITGYLNLTALVNTQH
ncbi:thermostable hemolysin [Solemya velum gill symbiont]|uniref:thermostable hemolysin n=1 Tax=Solemya velum gill symbiont TaxID=2340 RepID=UPI001E4BEDB3|nr:thermostable hemolysin [Solemya velum gill symbiont]